MSEYSAAFRNDDCAAAPRQEITASDCDLFAPEEPRSAFATAGQQPLASAHEGSLTGPPSPLASPLAAATLRSDKGCPIELQNTPATAIGRFSLC